MLRALVNCAKAVLSALYVTIKKPGESFEGSQRMGGGQNSLKISPTLH
jgi:hypothetical protein